MSEQPPDADRILAFWYPPGLDVDADVHRRQFEWWFRGGGNAVIRRQFPPVLAAAAGGALDGWAATPRGRLALIIVLDQFSRVIHADTPAAYANDARAAALAVEGLANGFYGRFATVWEKQFFLLPLGHSEDLVLHRTCVALCEALAAEAPAHLREIYAFSASQARGHHDVVARFGRHPHRNAVLGRVSTEEERAYIAAGDFVHRRAMAL